MQKRLGVALAAVSLLAVPVAARAQAHAMGAEHEVGIDVVAGYESVGNSGGNGLFIGTPVDVRLGWISHSNMSLETRTTLALNTIGTTTYDIDPGLNLLFKMGRAAAMNNNSYFTVGADLQIINNGTTSGATPAINGGIGIRRPYGSAAWRLEPGFRYVFKNTSLGTASLLQIGVRAGISMWH